MDESPDDWELLKDVVADALELPSEERLAFVDAHPSLGDGSRERAHELVRAADLADERVPDRAPELSATPAPGTWAGQRVGSYTVRAFVARGGMGEVYEAEQDGTGRRVAIKFLAPGPLADRDRFVREGQLLGRLTHPAIGQIVEADVHRAQDGVEWPYFALEFVDGVPLTDYARTRRLTRTERIELFVEVCRGVHHAHEKGVVHRDLKPENILVATPDVDASLGQPKILDFGVASSLSAEDEGTRLTQVGELVGTLAYMSPEQVEGRPDAVDARSDVHALGAILFQLLTDRLPFVLEGLSIPQAVRILAERDAPRLSSIDGSLRGDLDTIVAKALEKSADRRYSSAAELAADLTRTLRHEPIAARPASGIYRLRKLARRNRGLTVGLSLAFAILLAGIATTGFYLVRSNHLLVRANDATGRANREAERAGEETERQRRINEFLRTVLATPDPSLLGKDLLVRDLLDFCAALIPETFPDDPDIRADLHMTIGDTYFELGEMENGLEQRALSYEARLLHAGPDDADTLWAERWRNEILAELDSTSDEALARAREFHARVSELVGARTELGIGAAQELGWVLRERGELAESAAVYRDALDAAREVYGETAEDTLTVANNLGGVLLLGSEFEEALELAQFVYETSLAHYGEADPETIEAQGNFATVLSEIGYVEEGLAEIDQAIERGLAVWDADHHWILSTLSSRNGMLSELGRNEEAADSGFEIWEARRAKFGDTHSHTLDSLHDLVMYELYCERMRSAEEHGQLLLELAPRCEGASDYFAMRANALLVAILSNQDRRDEALPLSLATIDAMDAMLGPSHISTVVQRNNHAFLLFELGRFAEAAELQAEILETWTAEYPGRVGEERVFRLNLGRFLAAAGDGERAEAELLRSCDMALEGAGGPGEAARALEVLGELYRDQGRDDEAAAIVLRVAELRGAP